MAHSLLSGDGGMEPGSVLPDTRERSFCDPERIPVWKGTWQGGCTKMQSVCLPMWVSPSFLQARWILGLFV